MEWFLETAPSAASIGAIIGWLIGLVMGIRTVAFETDNDVSTDTVLICGMQLAGAAAGILAGWIWPFTVAATLFIGGSYGLAVLVDKRKRKEPT